MDASGWISGGVRLGAMVGLGETCKVEAKCDLRWRSRWIRGIRTTGEGVVLYFLVIFYRLIIYMYARIGTLND